MSRHGERWVWVLVTWAGLAVPGCMPYYPEAVRQCVGGLSSGPLDVQTVAALGPGRPFPAPAGAPAPQEGGPKDGKRLLQVPRELPGAEAPPIRLPKEMPKT